MRCSCCNRNLSDYESTLRSAKTNEYLDTCRSCLKDLGIETLPNKRDPYIPAPEDFDVRDIDVPFFEKEDDVSE